MYLHEAYEARKLSDFESTFQMITEDYEQEKSFAARRAAKERLKRDPKQRDKKFVLDCWVEWQAKPSNYLSKAEFARDMLQKCAYLKSNKKIEDWCREWEQKKIRYLMAKTLFAVIVRRQENTHPASMMSIEQAQCALNKLRDVSI